MIKGKTYAQADEIVRLRDWIAMTSLRVHAASRESLKRFYDSQPDGDGVFNQDLKLCEQLSDARKALVELTLILR